jgi:Zn-dependent peptidase ImmA (M78 family)/DNA-binding XRE family transcriptional regulator
MMATAYINPEIIKWGRTRLDIPQQVVADKLHVNFDKYLSWETGKAFPTINQAMNIGHILKIPFGYLYLSTPPEADELPITDFRTIRDLRFQDASVDLRDMINIVLRQQEWYSAYSREEEKAPLSFIGSFSLTDSLSDIVADIRGALSWPDRLFSTVYTRADYLRSIVELCEKVGIMVVRSGIVGNNTRRKLSISEFRGFAICDDYSPYIFINSNDCYAGQIFTLAHELGHLWFGKSGISNLNPDDQVLDDYQDLERICNQIAAELLAPETLLPKKSLELDYQAIIQLSKDFKISTIVVLRRLLETRVITKKKFFGLYDQMLKENANLEKSKASSSSGGGNFYNNFFAKTGKPFTDAVISSIQERRLLYRDAADLLSVSVPVVYKLIDMRSFT